MNTRLIPDFFLRDVLDVAPALLGKLLVRKFDDGRIERYQITDVDAYRGKADRFTFTSFTASTGY
jgi:DNA-3-methyladenine glycosylase